MSHRGQQLSAAEKEAADALLNFEGNIDSVSGTPTPTPWTTEMYEKHLDACYKKPRTTLDEGVGYAKRFLNWYAGQMIEEDDLLDTYHSLLSCYKYDQKYILSNKVCLPRAENAPEDESPMINLEEDDPTKPPNALQAVKVAGQAKGQVAKAVDKMKLPKWDWYEPRATNIMSVSVKVGANKVSISSQSAILWYDLLFDWLSPLDPEKKDQHAHWLKNREYAMGIVVLMALNSFRLITKDPQSVSNHYLVHLKGKIDSLLKVPILSLPEGPAAFPPSSPFLKATAALFAKGSTIALSLSTWMIESFINSDSENVKALWKAGCALSLAYTGLGSISWFEKAAIAQGKPKMEMLRELAIPLMSKFIIEYAKLAKQPDASWVYCRLLSESALAQFSALKLPVPTATFVALSSPMVQANDESWQYESLKRIPKNYVMVGFAIAKTYMELQAKLGWDKPLNQAASQLVKDLEEKGAVYMEQARKKLAIESEELELEIESGGEDEEEPQTLPASKSRKRQER